MPQTSRTDSTSNILQLNAAQDGLPKPVGTHVPIYVQSDNSTKVLVEEARRLSIYIHT